MKKEEVILVDAFDNAIGVMEKLEAHQKGLLHRAFSVFIFNEQGELLLQRRALTKYHSPGLWTNTCCSHPRPNEETITAANRRLKEEMGLETPLTYKTSFTYRAEFDNHLIEHEYDHVFIGKSNSDPNVNSDEVDSFKWINMAELKKQLKTKPEDFTAWFIIAMDTIF
jgi:isopentenyl-diphosphate delta-isomerase